MNPLKRILAVAAIGGAGLAAGGCALLGIPPINSPSPGLPGILGTNLPTNAALPTPDPSKITGNGTNDNPYVAPCADPQDEDCTVLGANDGQPNNAPYIRHLPGYLTGRGHETVPAYRCPTDHPYLLNHDFAPFGTVLVTGVEIQENESRWRIAVYIASATVVHPPPGAFANGIRSGPLDSGATNYGLGTDWYHPILHCTSNPSHGWLGQG